MATIAALGALTNTPIASLPERSVALAAPDSRTSPSCGSAEAAPDPRASCAYGGAAGAQPLSRRRSINASNVPSG